MTFGTENDGSQIPNDFCDPLTFPAISYFFSMHLIELFFFKSSSSCHVLETQFSLQLTSDVDFSSLGDIRRQEFNTRDAGDPLHCLLRLCVQHV